MGCRFRPASAAAAVASDDAADVADAALLSASFAAAAATLKAAPVTIASSPSAAPSVAAMSMAAAVSTLWPLPAASSAIEYKGSCNAVPTRLPQPAADYHKPVNAGVAKFLKQKGTPVSALPRDPAGGAAPSARSRLSRYAHFVERVTCQLADHSPPEMPSAPAQQHHLDGRWVPTTEW
jgi:hypothetical protein